MAVGVGSLLLLALLALAAVHTSPVRGFVLRRLTTAVRASFGIEVRASSLSYNLLALSAELRDVELAAVHSPDEPFGSAATIGAAFGARALLGHADLQRLSLTSPRIAVRQREDGSDNLPTFDTDSDGDGFALRDLDVEDLDVVIEFPATTIEVRGVAATMAIPSLNAVDGRVEAKRGVSVVVNDRTYQFDAAASALTYGDGILTLRDFTATRPGASLEANGTLTFGGETTTDLDLKGSTDLASWQAAGSDDSAILGRVDMGGRVTGRFTDPTVEFSANGQALAWSSIEIATARASGRYQNGVVTLGSYVADLASGTIEGRGAIALGAASQSRLEARWSNVDARQLLGASTQVAAIVAQSGSGEVRWRGGDAVRPFQLEMDATTGVVAAGQVTSLVVRARGIGDRWRVDVSPGDADAWDFELGGDVLVNRDRWQRSAVDGRLVFRTSDAQAAIARAYEFGVPLGGIDTTTAAGSVDVEAAIGGALGAIRGAGRFQGRGLTVAGAPPADLTGSFAIDMGERTSTGDFRVTATDLSRWRSAWLPALDLRGSMTASGTWSGPLANPVVEATVAARDLGAVRPESIPLAVAAGTFDATFTGPIDALGGRGRVVAGAIDVSGRSIGGATLDLTLDGRSLAVEATVPGVNTRIAGSITLGTPYSFVARGTTTSFELIRLASWFGASSVAVDDLTGTVSASLEAAGSLADPRDATSTMVVSPLDARVYGVPLRAPSGLRATLRGDQVAVDEFELTLGAIVLRAGCDVGLHEPAGGAKLTVNGDVASLAPWLARIDAERPWTMAGRVDGSLTARRTSAGVALSGSLASAVTMVARGERVLARDARVLIELTESRAVVRSLTGRLLGGSVEGSATAPLTWLGVALPGGWQIQSPATDEPATASLQGTIDVATALEEFAPGRSAGLGGRMVVAADLSAARPDLAAISGVLRFDQAQVTTGDTTIAQTETTRLRVAGGQVTVESLHWQGPQSEFIGSGVVGLLSGTRTDARLDVDSTLGVTAGVLRGRATGQVTGSIVLGGTGDRWRVTVDAALADARWLVPEARVLLAGWSGRLRLDENEITMAGFSGLVNGGSVKIDGRLPLTAASTGERDGIRITANDVLLEVPQGLRSQVNADLGWRPAGGANTLGGTVTITANRYSEPVTRVLALVRSLSRTTGGRSGALPDWLATTQLAVDVVVTDPVIVDNSVSSVELVPNLRLVGTVLAPALDGRIDVEDNGRIRIGGRTYTLHESRLRFAPADGLAPTLEVIGETRVGDYDVTLRIRGTPGNIETRFSSSPPLGQRDLQSLLLTGRIDATGDVSGADRFAGAAAATDILGFAGKFVGLDSVRVGSADLDLATKDVNTDQHLTISKSFGSRFEVIVSDNLETGALTWVIAWRPGAGYEIRAASVENTSESLEVRRTTLFGPGAGTGPAASPSPTTAPPVVADLVIDGSPGFPEDELRRALHLEPGDRFSVRRWIDDRLRLENYYNKRGYHRVRITPTRIEGPAQDAERTVTLRYGIDRGPKTIVEAVGDDLPSEAVSAMYDQWRGVPVAEVLVGAFENIARNHLAERGYHRANVSVELTADTADLAQAIVRVDRGPRTRRQTIEWNGNTAVSTSELNALVPNSPGRFDAQSVEWEIEALYRGRGYHQAGVEFGEPRFDGDLVTRPISIQEGRLSRIVDVNLDGVAPERVDAAQVALDLRPGAPYVFSSTVEATRRLETFYRNLGYRDAKVSHAITPDDAGDVILALTVAEGTRYQIGAVHVSGVESTNSGLVRDAITLAPGAVAAADAAHATRQNLFDIGSFRHVEVSFVPPAAPAPAATDLAIQVEEPRRFQLRYGGQVSKDLSAFGESGSTALGATVELRDRNFIGRAVQASLGAHYRPDFQTLTLLLTAPRLFGRPLSTNIYARERREETEIGAGSILDRRREVTLTQRKLVKGGLELAWGYDFAHRVFLLRSPAGEIDLGGFLAGPKVSVVIDRRDSPFDAKGGLFHSSSVQVGVEPLGSDLGFVRLFTRQSFYRSLGPVTLAGNSRLGILEAYSGQAPLTILDQFFQAGGGNTVRGYSEEALSALSILNIPVGGTEVLILNGEVRFPILGWFTGAAFVDGGNTFTSFQDITLGKLAVGAGIGLRVQTPFVPFRFDFGYPMTSGYGKRQVRFHFSVGQMF